MERRKKWTKEEVLLDAKRFKYKNLWRVKSKGAYAAARKLNILSDCYSHMQETRNPYKSGGVVYAFEFDNNTCYIGLSCNLITRFLSHMERGPVSRALKAGAKFKFKILEHKTVCPLETKEKEVFWAAFYELNKWSLLNKKSNLGALGGSVLKRNKKAVIKSSLKFNSVKEWRKNEEGSYRAAIKLGILDELTVNMKKGKGRGVDNSLFRKKNALVSGEKHGQSKLTKGIVLDIRNRWKNKERQSAIADLYSIDQSTVSDIVNGYRWRDI